MGPARILNNWNLANFNGSYNVFTTKLNPAPADPIQAKIFAFFPLFLTIILAPFPSGLVVYWTINNILTIAQQWVIMRQTKVKTN